MVDKLSSQHQTILQHAEGGLSYADSAKILDVSRSSIRRYAMKNNIEFSGKRQQLYNNPEKIKEIVDMYKAGKTGDYIAEVLNVNRQTVYGILGSENAVNRNRYNYKYRPNGVNIEAFADFETDRSAAYYYGLLITDGCLSDRGQISISLKIEDGYILDSLLKYLGLEQQFKPHSINLNGKRYGVARMSFTDSEIISRLKEQGLSPRKSGKEKLPKFDYINGETAKDFWRGCIDGDGWVCCYQKTSVIGLCGSEELLEGFIEFCKVSCGITKVKNITKVQNTEVIKQVRYHNGDALKIAKVLWEPDTLYLKRKYLQVQNIIEKEENRK